MRSPLTKIIIILVASYVFIAIYKKPEKAAVNKPQLESPQKTNTIIAAREVFDSAFIQDWIGRMESPFFAIGASQLTELCLHKSIEINLNAPLTCPDSLDFKKLSESFQVECASASIISLSLKNKASCNATSLDLLRQKKYSGPLEYKNGVLSPNVKDYPLLSQMIPITTNANQPAQLIIPTPENWLRGMHSGGAIRVVLHSTKAAPRVLASVAKIFADFDTPTKFSPQIKFQGPPVSTINLLPSDLKISWTENLRSDKASQSVCNLISGWIDYELLKNDSSSTSDTVVDLQCSLEFVPSLEFQKSSSFIEIGYLPLPLVTAKTGAFLFPTLAEALSPSTLLGLRLDL